MKNLRNIENVYFLGIGGIGMSALARYFKFNGMNVAGYDRTPSPLTEKLQAEGIDVHYDDDIRNIPTNWNPEKTIAVYTPALPDSHNELSWFKAQPIGLFKRAKILGLISNEKSGIAIAGTHGKTSVSTMVANTLNKTEHGCGAFLGGISKNFGSNLLLPKSESPWIVVEADEFDRSFHQLFPQLALITSVDADHLDIYGNKEAIVESFQKFISQIKPGGKLVLKKGVDIDAAAHTSAQIYSYSINEDADFCAVNLHLNSGGGFYEFDFKTPDGTITGCKTNYPGLINVENAVGAASLAFLAGVSATQIKAGMEDYSGVARRFDVQLKNEKTIYIDDYAHHPEELKAVISSVKELYKNRKVTGIFQPHLYSRTKDFAPAFAESLDLLDSAVLIPLYPAREEPVEGVSSELIFNKMKLQNKFLLSKEQTLQMLRETPQDVVLTMGAGDIDRMVKDIVEILKQKN